MFGLLYCQTCSLTTKYTPLRLAALECAMILRGQGSAPGKRSECEEVGFTPKTISDERKTTP